MRILTINTKEITLADKLKDILQVEHIEITLRTPHN